MQALPEAAIFYHSQPFAEAEGRSKDRRLRQRLPGFVQGFQAISATTEANACAGSAAWLIGRPITR
ncbi:hypothetical protein PS906_00289 [Pseudomonas fluorescens]|nr:hypothetical protein PS906_00289 [Pseudomonas fluorescens]